MKIKPLLAISLILTTLTSSAIASSVITKAVNNPARPEADVKRDINRKPEAVLKFFDVRPGMTVLDMYATGGYYTEMLSYIVGKKGTVITHNSNGYRKFVGQSINDRFLNGRLPNVEKIYAHPREIQLKPQSLDMALMVLIYHDMYVTNAKNLITADNRKNLISQILAGLKPGGILGIVDHAAPRGSGAEAATKWHRLSSSIVTKELVEFGFEFIDENTALRNRSDTHEISIFDKTVHRKTDRYILKFRKPKLLTLN